MKKIGERKELSEAEIKRIARGTKWKPTPKGKIGVVIASPHTIEEFGFTTDEKYLKNFGTFDYHSKYITKADPKFRMASVYFSHRKDVKVMKHPYGHELVRFPIVFGFGVGEQFSCSFLKWLWKNRKDIQILHTMSYHALQYESMVILAKLLGMKVVAEYNSGVVHWHNPIHVVRMAMLFFSLRFADVVLTVKPKEREFLKKWGIKAHLFPTGVDPNLQRPLNLKRKKNNLLFIGSFFPEKGIIEMLDAFKIVKKKIPDLSLIMVGRGPLSEPVAKKIKDEKIKDVKVISEFIHRNEVVRLLNTCEAQIMPSRHEEPYGMVAMEALMCKTPTLSSDRAGVTHDMGRFGVIYSLNVDTPKTLARDILKALKNKKKLRTMAVKGREVAIKYHAWQVVGKKLAKVYNEVLSGKRSKDIKVEACPCCE